MDVPECPKCLSKRSATKGTVRPLGYTGVDGGFRTLGQFVCLECQSVLAVHVVGSLDRSLGEAEA